MRTVSKIDFHWLKDLLPRLHVEVDLKRLCQKEDLSFLLKTDSKRDRDESPTIDSISSKKKKIRKESVDTRASTPKNKVTSDSDQQRLDKVAAAKARLLERKQMGLVGLKKSFKYK